MPGWKDIEIEVETKIIDGWIDEDVEYCLAEIKVGNNPSELYLFWGNNENS